jgi:hypothetical protein
MSRLPSVVMFIADARDVPIRTIERGVISRRTLERWFKEGRIFDAYQSPGGHWRIRRSSQYKADNIINHVSSAFLQAIERRTWFFPLYPELKRLEEFLPTGHTLEFNSFSEMKRLVPLLSKALQLLFRGEKVNRASLADAFDLSVPTLCKRYGKELIRDVCRNNYRDDWLWGEHTRKDAKKTPIRSGN